MTCTTFMLPSAHSLVCALKMPPRMQMTRVENRLDAAALLRALRWIVLIALLLSLASVRALATMNQYAQIGFGVALGAALYHLYTRRQKSKPIVHTYKPLDIDKLPSSPVTLLTQWKAEAEEQFGPAEAKCMVVRHILAH